jgi:hypothetical protein
MRVRESYAGLARKRSASFLLNGLCDCTYLNSGKVHMQLRELSQTKHLRGLLSDLGGGTGCTMAYRGIKWVHLYPLSTTRLNAL